ncbi:hypothetical protein BKP42_53860 [Rhodococcus erythropolis]|uniref:hypothetical protein n=1 Tax=Rhodococcus erythropolis TaxID=1833 RepID=UPI000BB3AA9D|nr:hypothetical protein [Rhodococcus erythropolis]PBI91967.1 hypothetical protein BKP42_53860 [Rhodococcus erythropolis]
MTIHAPPRPYEGSDPDDRTTNIHIRAEVCRHAAVLAAKNAQKKIALALFDQLPHDEYDEDAVTAPHPILNHDPDHPGSAAENIDVAAHSAAVSSLAHDLRRDLGITSEELVLAGEEVPERTKFLNHNAYLARLDACDGTTNSQLYWNGHSSVVLLDQVRLGRDGSGRARHLGGAIACPHAIISWTNSSPFDQVLGRYPQVSGYVYFEHPQFIGEQRIHARRWSRSTGTIAAVAHSDERYQQVRKIATAHALDVKRFLSAGGTPLASALLGGNVDAIIEPHHVTLHDSALLIPHQLLGGAITDLDGKPFDYLHLYETTD